MSEELRNKLRIERGHTIYVYDLLNLHLIFVSDSKQFLINNINISRESINECLKNGNFYLNRFYLSSIELEPSELLLIINNENNLLLSSNIKFKDLDSDLTKNTILTLESFKDLILSCRSSFVPTQPASKQAENLINPSETQIFDSINAAAKELKTDRVTIRKYLADSNKLFRKT
jgi:hypothetical protein